MTDALTWAGTFHGIGARLLRDYADQIGLDPAFTIHDREDSADLMNLVRHELGFSKTESRFPDQGHLPRDLFALRQCRDRRSRRCWARHSPGAPDGRPSCATVRGLCRGQAAPERARLRRPAALLGADDERSGARRRHRRPLRPCAGRRVSGHQPAAVLDPAGAEARRPRPHRGRRRCAVDLLVPRRDGAQHPRLSRASSRRRPRSSRSTATTARRSRSSRPPTP